MTDPLTFWCTLDEGDYVWEGPLKATKADVLEQQNPDDFEVYRLSRAKPPSKAGGKRCLFCHEYMLRLIR